MVDFLGAESMNAYVYAPKSDPKHRDRWRDAYDDGELRHFADVIARSRAAGVRFGFALSPGVDVDYASATDRAAVLAKLVPMLDLGVDWIVLALDDIETRPGLAGEQAALTGWLLGELRDRNATLRLSLVPTEYVGRVASPYLRELGAGVPVDVDLMWTGPTVCSPVIRAADARAWGEAVGRPPIVWDNFPVNDGTMARSLHLGPYIGREPALTDAVEGVLCNPMLQPRLSKIGLAGAAAYLRDPSGFDPHGAWEHGVEVAGGEHAALLKEVGSACANSPILPTSFTKARRWAAALAEGADTGPDSPVEPLRAHLRGVRDATRVFGEATDDPLHEELGPWLEPARAEAEAGLAAVRLIEHVRAEATPESAMQLAFGTLFAWDYARQHPDRVVFGPRFAAYPAVVQLDDGAPALDVDLALVEGENAIDELCHIALDRYRDWVRVRVEASG